MNRPAAARRVHPLSRPFVAAPSAATFPSRHPSDPSASAAPTRLAPASSLGPLRLERTPVSVHAAPRDAALAVARHIADLIRRRHDEGRHAVLGLATGSTPLGVYEELIRLHRRERLSFRRVITFNLDEYYPIRPSDLQSYRRFMRENLFDHVDIPHANVHIPDGSTPHRRVAAACAAYERAIRDAGGIDLQLLGLGRTGHIGFNEPGSPRASRTRLIDLDRVTRVDAAADFFGESNVPRRALTMGVGTILDARAIILLAFGEHKAPVVRRAVEGPVDPALPASFLQEHPAASVVLDHAAAADLTRFRTPWVLGPVADLGLRWDHDLSRRAVIWLAETVGKPILTLTNEDYSEHHLQELLASRPGGAYDLNLEVFRSLQSVITGWPGGPPARRRSPRRPGAARHAPLPEPTRAARARRILVFSPHPDDDVISMGGTLTRLCAQGHLVHVAYQTTGNIAVFDHSALRHADFAAEFARAFHLPAAARAARLRDDLSRFIRAKRAGEVDSTDLQQLKTLIRRTEARAAARASGVAPSRIHFLDLPFYQTGRVRKKPLSSADVRLVARLLARVRPHQVYAAGDLSDPHGTHRVCLDAVTQALAASRRHAWARACQVWLYRGAWQEWDIHQIQMAVPLSPGEVERKRLAIFKHESQKDRALFPGPDAREFWQRAEDRNRRTAERFDRLGLTQFQAIEGFVRWTAPASA